MGMLKNRAVWALTGGDIFETLGISVFNIILLMYAKEFTNAKLMITLVSIGSILTGILSVFIGRLSDCVHHKSRYLVLTKFIQAGMYILLANIIDERTEIIMLIIILINILSDCIGSYNGGLRLVIMKNKIPASYRQQVIGLNQSTGALLQPVGQAIGVAILGATHDYALAGYVNAFTFIIAAVILMVGYSHIKTVVPPAKLLHAKGFLFKNIKTILNRSSGMSVVPFLATIMLINSIGSALDTVLNLFLLTNEHITSLSFGIEILIVTIVFMAGTVLGGVTNFKLIDQLSFKVTTVFETILLILIFVNFALLKNYWILLVMLFLGAFFVSKANAKINALIIEMTEPDMLATVSGTITSMAMIAVPAGTITVGVLYNVVSPIVTYLFGMVVLIIALGCAVFSKSNA